MTTLFYLDDLEIEEPQGFGEIVLNLSRDDNWHGVFSEASASSLGFYGVAAIYLKNKKTTEGLRADVTFRALMTCGGVYDEQQDILTGKIDFRTYKETAGQLCLVYAAVQQTGCAITLRNRYDQKVNMDSNIAFDGITGLQPYAGLGHELTLPTRELQVATEGFVVEGGDVIDLEVFATGTRQFWVRPTYGRQIFANINESQLTPTVFAASDNGVNDSVISPVLLFDDDINCFSGEFAYEFILKGSYDFTFSIGGSIDFIRLQVVRGEFPSTLTVLHTVDLPVDPMNNDHGIGAFDENWSGVITLAEGEGLYTYLTAHYAGGLAADIDGSVTFDEETYVNIEGIKSCPPTTAETYFIHEALSRATEAITDGCLTVKSNYYGRADSEPYAADQDGCGGLRVITNGLKIRKAVQDNYFVSLKELFDGLKPIDNIGMGLEENPNTPNTEWLRVEDVSYFYRDEEVLSFPSIPKVDFELDENKHYSLIKAGFEKWEVENINGLEEFNSTREYRTGLTAVNNTADLVSKFVAGSIPIEITRQQSFADTGAADTKFDNETFIIVLDRISYGFQVEQGNIDNPVNIFSPDTVYNWRIRPYYNLMRWFKSLANSYPNIDDTANKLYFSSGTGNYTAEGELIEGLYDPDCKLENGVKAENRNLSKLDFSDVTEATPLWRPEPAIFTYPLSVQDYKLLKANPYGYISFQPGGGEFLKGFIQSVKYKLNEGTADFVLKIKWS